MTSREVTVSFPLISSFCFCALFHPGMLTHTNTHMRSRQIIAVYFRDSPEHGKTQRLNLRQLSAESLKTVWFSSQLIRRDADAP